jgi:outer membrane protein assembly factor BamD (BamD/ComL family)
MCSEQCSAEGAEARQSSRRSARAYISVLFLLSVGLLASLPAACQETVVLSGQVVTYTGQTVPSGVTITLETESGERAAQTPANTEGRFELANLKKLRYRMTVTAEGFETWQQDLDLGHGASQYTVRITLTPLNKIKQIPASAPALTDEQARKTARKEYEKGSRALAARQLDEARTHLEKALSEFPCYARAQTDLAVVLTERRELPGAEAALRQAVQCDPGFPDAYTQLGQLLNAEKKFAESADLLQDGLRRSPGAWQFYYQLAIAHFGLKQYSQAEEEYLKVQSLNPNPPADLHVKLADVYLKENAYDKAYAQMQAYLRAEPEGRFAAKIKAIMRQIEFSGALRAPPTQSAQPPPG